MRSSFPQIDFFVYGNLIQYFSNNRLPLQGKQLHARLVLSSVIGDNYLASKLITFYAKSVNDLQSARNLFDRIPSPNTFSYNALLIAYTANHCHNDVFRLFSSLAAGNGPDGYSVTCFLKSLPESKPDGSRTAKEVHLYVLKNSLDKDAAVGNILITCYSKLDEFPAARKVFDGMTEKDAISWNAMISGYSQAGLYKRCKEMYLEMMKSSPFEPVVASVVSVLQACKQSEDLAFVMDVHRYVKEKKLSSNMLVLNSLISAYANCGSLIYANELFQEAPTKDEVTYNTMISSYMNHGYVDLALHLFDQMPHRVLATWNAVLSGLSRNTHHESVLPLFKSMQDDGFHPNSVTLASILPSIADEGNLRAGKEAHSYALKTSCSRDVHVATGLIDTYAKCGMLNWARRVFEESKERSVIMWTAMISAYGRYGEAKHALEVLKEMGKKGMKADKVTVVSVLASCRHGGMVEEGLGILREMRRRYGVEASTEHYACVVGALGRAGRAEEARLMLRGIGLRLSAKLWGALLDAAVDSADVELGEFAFANLLKIEPHWLGGAVALRNLYSTAHRWEDARRAATFPIHSLTATS